LHSCTAAQLHSCTAEGCILLGVYKHFRAVVGYLGKYRVGVLLATLLTKLVMYFGMPIFVTQFRTDLVGLPVDILETFRAIV
jgi:hypothetical protein